MTDIVIITNRIEKQAKKSTKLALNLMLKYSVNKTCIHRIKETITSI